MYSSQLLLSARQSILLALLFMSTCSFAQEVKDWQLERMPVELERDFALSALPPHLRDSASIYLLDPRKGYYLYKKGSNGFSCFICRTEWEWEDFQPDNATAISFDEEGSRTIMPVLFEVAAMRATGRYTAHAIYDTVMQRIQRGVYKAPSRPGISYMLAPLMRTYPGKKQLQTMRAPHIMFYAPYMTNKDIGGDPSTSYPVIVTSLKSPFTYIIVPLGSCEKSKILTDNQELLQRLADYKPYFKTEAASSDKHH